MNDDTRTTITAAIDRLAARGVTADTLALHPDTARELGILSTHLDWSSPLLHPSASQIAAELSHPEYDRRPERDPHPGGALTRPKLPEEAAQLAAPRCAEKHRRDVKLAVTLDSSVPVGKLRVTGRAPMTEEV